LSITCPLCPDEKDGIQTISAGVYSLRWIFLEDKKTSPGARSCEEYNKNEY
jgi:hypothetical protein